MSCDDLMHDRNCGFPLYNDVYIYRQIDGQMDRWIDRDIDIDIDIDIDDMELMGYQL